MGLKTFPGVGNFVLCELPAGGAASVDAATLVARCRERGVFIRDASAMGRSLGGGAGAGYVRIAVKDARGNARVVEGVSVIRVEVQWWTVAATWYKGCMASSKPCVYVIALNPAVHGCAPRLSKHAARK